MSGRVHNADMNQTPTTDFTTLRTVQRFWNNQLIKTFADAHDAIERDDPKAVSQLIKRAGEIEMRKRKDYEVPYNELVGEKVYK